MSDWLVLVDQDYYPIPLYFTSEEKARAFVAGSPLSRFDKGARILLTRIVSTQGPAVNPTEAWVDEEPWGE